MSHRSERVAEEIRKVISEFVVRGLKTRLPGLVTISHVEINKDLTLAKVYYSVFGSDSDVKRASEILADEKKAIRQEVARKIRLRLTPELALIYDETPAKAARIDELLRKD
jgi:ribosome-binding factor A